MLTVRSTLSEVLASKLSPNDLETLEGIDLRECDTPVALWNKLAACPFEDAKHQADCLRIAWQALWDNTDQEGERALGQLLYIADAYRRAAEPACASSLVSYVRARLDLQHCDASVKLHLLTSLIQSNEVPTQEKMESARVVLSSLEAHPSFVIILRNTAVTQATAEEDACFWLDVAAKANRFAFDQEDQWEWNAHIAERLLLHLFNSTHPNPECLRSVEDILCQPCEVSICDIVIYVITVA